MAGSNWAQLQKQLKTQSTKKTKTDGEKKRDLVPVDKTVLRKRKREAKKTQALSKQPSSLVSSSEIVAMDCEMVGVGLNGKRSVLARCSIVNYSGIVLYDEIIQPLEKVTDFRTHVSGIRKYSLRKAVPFHQALSDVGKVMKDKILVGHALKNDFEALMFNHPKHLVRDTAKYRPFMKRRGTGTKLYPSRLRDLVATYVPGQEGFQEGEHDSVEDARCAMELYKTQQNVWEKCIASMNGGNLGGLIGQAPVYVKKAKVEKQNVMVKGGGATAIRNAEEEQVIQNLYSKAYQPKSKLPIAEVSSVVNLEFEE